MDSSTNVKSLSHLFPSMITRTPDIGNDKNFDDTLQEQLPPNHGIDYVIIFRYPTTTTTSDRHQLEQQVIHGLQSLTSKLTRAQLYFEIKQGQESGTLLVLVGCPQSRLYKEYKAERTRDFLLGISLDSTHLSGNTVINKDALKSSSSTFGQDFSEANRLRLIYDILTSSESNGGADISPHIDPFVESIMPLHNDEFNKKWISTWSKKWLIDNDDLCTIRNHFGEKIAFYFAFVQFYFLWLTIPAGLGVLVYFTNSNAISISYSLSILVWGITFTEMWKRKQKELAVMWDVLNCSKHEKRRAAFKGDTTVADQVTGEEMPFVSTWKIILRRVLAIPGVALGAILLLFIVTFVFMLQLFLHEYYTGPFRSILHYAPTIGYVLLIPTMSGIYSTWVRLLTNWEMHKTETSWEFNYTQKIFVANFLVGYLSLFFIAWIYIPFGDHVLPYLIEFNISHEHQKVDFQRLRDQLVYFVVTGQVVGFFTEMVVPYLMAWLMPKAKKFMSKVVHRHSSENQSSSTIKDKNISSSLLASPSSSSSPSAVAPLSHDDPEFIKKIYKEVGQEEYNIYTDYVEMIIQFGYVSMFSPVWPLTALCCLANNWIELRSDAVKICKYTRRPSPLRAESIGPWLGNMETIVWLSSITMASFAYLFHPTTNIHSSHVPIYSLLAILLSEHLYAGLSLAIRSIISVIPNWPDVMIKKEDYRMKKHWLQRLGDDTKADEVSKHDPMAKVWDQVDLASMTDIGMQFIQNHFKSS
ncbi:calcium-activated chloride channel-domain-containing protein [Halteromyces radiatus]|uniref:calcium-activated chloride channel-domain-containing protein n=1 Tax=Halteromyces radiatus TaxID=101107 RepID=UPI00221EC706|nr:calcium-activated chloride channel-domain-containing protein [Halteromyces radiatus]KAI8099070.1 calcium-activated chloride channel-domain-containing protein [Halteromyces radiatus]